jgi:hypothetical protein
MPVSNSVPVAIRRLAVCGTVCAVLSGCAHSTSPAERPEPGLLARFDFNEGAGSVLHDRSGHGFDGTLKGGVVWKDGIAGTSLEFNGTDGYVQLPADSAFLLDSFTVAAWIRPADQGPGERVMYSNLESTAGLATGGTEFRFRGGQLEGVSAGSPYGGNWSDMLRDASLDSAWHFVAFTVAGGYGSLWVDAARAGDSASWRPIAQPASLPQIGAALRNWADPGFFKGRIDELRIYSRGLKPAELSALYARYRKP